MKASLRAMFYLILAAVLTPLVGTAFAEDTGTAVIIESPSGGNRAPWRGGGGDGMRFQCLWLQSSIGHTGYVNQIEFSYYSGTVPASFNSCSVLLCHTSASTLVETFATNYGGNTPVEVYNGTMTLNGSDWLDLGITPNAFNYNNSDNLLMEVVWNGDSGSDVYCYRSTGTARRAYSYTYNASSGSVYDQSQYIRLHIGTMTGVAPTSLGRVRAIFQ
jgi:hypothetical protein